MRYFPVPLRLALESAKDHFAQAEITLCVVFGSSMIIPECVNGRLGSRRQPTFAAQSRRSPTGNATDMWNDLKPLLGLVLRFLFCCALVVAAFLVEKLVLGSQIIGSVVFAALAVYLVRAAGRHIKL